MSEEKDDILSILGKAEEDFGWLNIGVEIKLSDLSNRIGKGIHAKEIIQMILFHKIENLNQSIIHLENQKGSDNAILQGLREGRDAYEKFALMSEELPD